jgi:integrase
MCFCVKLPNSHGTVYKEKGRRRKPWAARITVGWSDEGKQIRQLIGHFATKQEGLDALAMHRISPVSPKSNITLSELYEDWSASKYRNISKATQDNYRAAWKYIKRYEKAKFKDLRTNHWQDVIDKCAEEKLSKSTLEKIRTLAVMLNNFAMQNDIINKNYAKFVALPKSERTKKAHFTDLEVKKISDAAKTVPWADTILIMIKTGLRISEMLGLTRFNVDLNNWVITGGIKTDAGKDRIIPVHEDIKEYIRKWFATGGETLICDDKGKKLTAKRYRDKMYYPALDAVGTRKLTPHACRHTFCTRLSDAGVKTVDIQKLAGHADHGFTANTYTHPEIEVLRTAVNKA